MIKQLLLIVGAIVLCVLIYIAPKTKQKEIADQKQEVVDKVAIPSGMSTAIAALSEKDRVKVSGFSDILANENENLPILDSLIRFWDGQNVEIAASYASQKADLKTDEKSNIAAAIRYFDAYKAARDSAKQSILVTAAIRYYERALENNPSNLNVRTDLGVCYAEATPAPMRGIKMLLDVVKEDPEHENAQLNLGFLSVKSGQYEKALERFDNVVKINPLRSEVYLFKAQTQLRMGDKSGALISFEQFIEKSTDQEMVIEVKKYIKQIKNS